MNIYNQPGTLKNRTYTHNQLLLTLLFLLTFSFSVYAATYYVDAVNGKDSNSGKSETSAWKTINKVNHYSFASGDIIEFKRGQIFQGYTLSPPRGNIVFTAYGTGSMPIIDGQNTRQVVNVNNLNSLTFKDIEFLNGARSIVSFAANTCNYMTIDNCIFDGEGTSGRELAYIGTQSDYLTVKNSTFKNGGIKYAQGAHGLYVAGDHIIVENCTFTNFIDGNGLKNNVVQNSGNVSADNNIIIRDNYFSNIVGGGIFLQSANGVKIYYNIFVIGKNLGHAIVLSYNSTYLTYAPHNIDIYNNTIILPPDLSSGGILLYGKTQIDNITIKNNLMYSTAFNYNHYFIDQQAGGGTHLYINNNLYYTAGGQSDRWRIRGTSYDTFNKWKSLGFDSEGLYANPIFKNYSNEDYSLQPNSPAINSGVNVGLSNDYLDNQIIGLPDIGAYEYQESTSSSVLKLNVKVYLAGCYNNGSMNTDLLAKGFLPTKQPYSSPPWNYPGNETLSSIPANMVDWILIELRSDTSGNSTIARRAAILLDNGTVVDLDGKSAVSFNNLLPGYYYIVLKHRNHLSVMSSIKVNFNQSITNYDFTTSESVAYGENPMENLGNNIYGMYSGDANGDGVISQSDMLNFWLPQFMNGLDGYNSADFNLDGSVTASDNNIYWQSNVGNITQVPN